MSPPTMWKWQGMNHDDTPCKTGSPEPRKRSDGQYAPGLPSQYKVPVTKSVYLGIVCSGHLPKNLRVLLCGHTSLLM